MKRLKKLVFSALAAAACAPAWAGYDIYGVVTSLQVRPDGSLWFAITPNSGFQPVTNFCAGGGMYVPGSDPQYAYYYGLLLSSLTKSKSIGLLNISTYNGTTACDISKTGYGVMLLQ
jgi:hypothetical protein